MKKSICKKIVDDLFLVQFYALHFLRLFFTLLLSNENCIHCGKPQQYFPLCPDCKKTTLDKIRLNHKRCSLCGKLLISEHITCPDCRISPVLQSIDQNFALYSYHLWAKDVLFLWKMTGNRIFSFELAKKLYVYWNVFRKDVIVVPVPPRPQKIAQNGWDQIQDIAQIAEHIFHIPVLYLLRRNSRTEQKKLSRTQRLENSENKYSVSRKAKKLPLFPQEVLLIDDILTTGATLESCAFTLKNAGVKRVFSFTFFIVN